MKENDKFNTQNDIKVHITDTNGGTLLQEDCCTCINILLKNNGELATSFLGSHNPYIVDLLEKAQKAYFKQLKKTLLKEYKDKTTPYHEQDIEDCNECHTCGCDCDECEDECCDGECECDDDCSCDDEKCRCNDKNSNKNNCGCGDKHNCNNHNKKKGKINCDCEDECECTESHNCRCEENLAPIKKQRIGKKK